MGALFGWIGSPDPGRLLQMKLALSHRGDACFIDEGPHFSLGYWSDSARPRCPLKNSGFLKSEQFTLVLAGFQTSGIHGPSPSLESLAEQMGRKLIPPGELCGDFVIAYARPNELILVRDGAGSRTLFFAEWNGRFYFASEPKAIWSMKGFPKKIEPNSLAKYLAFSFVPERATMLSNISELPAGHWLKWSGFGTVDLKRYFRFEEQEYRHLPNSSEDLADRWRDTFRSGFAKTVEDRIRLSQEPPTVFLSGGLDSSLVAAELKRQSDEVHSYSLHFGPQYPNELSFARAVADRLGTNHTEVLIEPREFLPDLRRMIWHLDDPVGDPITMPNFKLAEFVSHSTRYVFNGEGGDPCFGGPKNIPMMLEHWYGVERPDHFRELAYLASYRRAYEELEHLFTPEFRQQIEPESLTEVLKPYFESQRISSFLNKLMAINIRLKGAHLILPKVERMLAAHGISPLSPLFASEMIEFSFRIPPKLKLAGGIEKLILKRAYQNELPREVIERPKSGMRVPVHFWFQGELKKYARHLLSTRQIKRGGIFDHRRVKQLLAYNIEEGNGRYGIRLWMLLTFEIWRRLVIEGEPL